MKKPNTEKKKIKAKAPGMMASLFWTIIYTIKRKFQGQRAFVTWREFRKRVDACDDCGSLCHVQKRCTDCGCYLHVKTLLVTADCPNGAWS